MSEPVCIQENQEPAPDFVGLTEAEATELADERGLDFRIVGADGECFAVTADFNSNRVNVELSDDNVIAAALY